MLPSRPNTAIYLVTIAMTGVDYTDGRNSSDHGNARVHSCRHLYVMYSVKRKTELPNCWVFLISKDSVTIFALSRIRTLQTAVIVHVAYQLCHCLRVVLSDSQTDVSFISMLFEALSSPFKYCYKYCYSDSRKL